MRNPDEIRKCGLENLDLSAENIDAAVENAGDSGVDSAPLSEVSSAGVGLRDGDGLVG